MSKFVKFHSPINNGLIYVNPTSVTHFEAEAKKGTILWLNTANNAHQNYIKISEDLEQVYQLLTL